MKTRPERLIENVVIAAPCPMSWEAMEGDDKVRHCGGCFKNVYNVSAMNDKEVDEFLARNGDRQCMRFFRRADGTIMTDNCPVGLRKLRDRMRAIGRVAASFAAFVFAMPQAFAQTKTTLPAPQPPLPRTFQGGAPARHPRLPGEFLSPAETLVPVEMQIKEDKRRQKKTTAVKTDKNANPTKTRTNADKNATLTKNDKADNRALDLYKRATTEAEAKNYGLSEFLYEKAIDAAEAQGVACDPSFRKLLEGRLEDVRDHIRAAQYAK